MVPKKTNKKKAIKKVERLDHININAAGIDIGSRSHYVTIPEGRDNETVREFSTFTNSLIELVNWLKAVGITTVAMESTSVYWIPVYDISTLPEVIEKLISPFDSFPDGFYGYVKKSELVKVIANKTMNPAKN